MQSLPCELIKDQCFVAGHWIEAPDKRTFSVTNPATGQAIGSVPRVGAAQTLDAIERAKLAQQSWKMQPAKERARLLFQWAELVESHTEELARILTAEQGKPLAEARGEVGSTVAYLRWFAEEARRIEGQVLPSPSEDQHYLVFREPVGVCAAITPWNFPSSMIARKVAPALAAGCTLILKPAEQTPLSALALAALAEEAGLPAGVFSVITGDPQEIGDVLCASDTVRKISFTGSTQVGRMLIAQCAPSIKKLSLELGGNAPFIVFEDADLDAAVKSLVAVKFRNAGQMCTSANRVLVHAGIYDEFLERLIDAVKALKVGDGLDPGTQVGPLIDGRAVHKLDALIGDAVAGNARLLLGGSRHSLGGTFFEPTVLAEVDASMRMAREEIFGPVAALYRFSSEEEAIAMANATEYGLAAYFFSRDMARVFRVLRQLEYGMVGVNSHLIANEVAPFGGVKQSGLGREGAREGINEYLETKFACIQV
ncbi:succinate-semialdehyde dehydrogenase (NADP(+)) [Pseudomonas sp. 09C 129]|uniref:NAD-dependent succinate-semialdehyde dehydrogenase n=1 Tax=Pseudomonas sp. 09C 129 TaxID=2054915 RepID=UPI000C6D4F85|nr:NAD-dependent succinate-semialdehyde dehydrogenase [Pseudomonas sp. 09C 129]AUG01623.1 succinate-semialdehyde dehydrogenase (NADP(+)) [Pseudomonas sp. 09C 129]